MNKTINEIFKEHKEKCQVNCCEMHAHSAQHGCITGPKESVEICILGEEILRHEMVLESICDTATKYLKKCIG